MKKIILFMLLLCIITACGKTESKGNSNEEPPIPYGIKPVIYYHGNLYWIVKDINELPNSYHSSGDKIITSETNESTVPSEECHTSKFNSNNVGASIYIDPTNENTIIINCGDHFLVFSQDNIY